jgi:hypothetical protein
MDDMIHFDITIDGNALARRVENLIDDKTMLAIHQLLAKMCQPYVPMDTGLLVDSGQAFPEYVSYAGPYAHYMYMGEIYGPNYPKFDSQGNIIGWWSPPGKGTKYPTGRQFEYGADKHPLATHHWDQVMFLEHRDEFLQGVMNILERRARELYG